MGAKRSIWGIGCSTVLVKRSRVRRDSCCVNLYLVYTAQKYQDRDPDRSWSELIMWMRYVYKLRKVCIKSNDHSVTSVLIIFLPQLTTNLELTPKLCGQELRLPIAIAIWILILIKMALPCKCNSRSGSRSGSTYPDHNPENFVACERSINVKVQVST